MLKSKRIKMLEENVVALNNKIAEIVNGINDNTKQIKEIVDNYEQELKKTNNLIDDIYRLLEFTKPEDDAKVLEQIPLEKVEEPKIAPKKSKKGSK